jgi:hypothetical protein
LHHQRLGWRFIFLLGDRRCGCAFNLPFLISTKIF